MRPTRVNPLTDASGLELPGLSGFTRSPWEAEGSVCPGEVWLGKGRWRSAGAYRRGQPEGTVLYEAVRDNLATLLADVLACARCGGRLRVLAYLKAPDGVRAIAEHLELPTRPAHLAPAQGFPELWC